MTGMKTVNLRFYLLFVLRNLYRHPRRTLLTGAAAAFTAATLCFMFSYFNGVVDNIQARYARLETGHLRFLPQGYPQRESLLPLDLHLTAADSLRNYIAAQPEVEAATARIRFAALASSGDLSVPVAGLGVDFAREANFLNPAALLTEGRLPQSSGEAVIGALLARRLNLSVGDTLLLLGQDSRRSLTADEFRLTGLISLGMNPIDRRSVYLPLPEARAFTDLPDRATEILALLHDPQADRELRDRLQEASLVRHQEALILTWREHGDLYRVIASSRAIVQLLILLFLAIAASTVVNTILMAVLERGREIGMLKALGMGKGNIAGLFLLEGALIGALFAPLGALLGAAAGAWTERVGIPLGKVGQNLSFPMGNFIYPDFRWTYYWEAVAFTLLMSLLASLYPAWKAGKVNSASALRVHQ
ncbi:MAG: ABC transporter permease [Candidatus Zixiibacteriota bacterium]|nr:MAG: ABC transporter permease [candidate division Zixibacteria bacterium]